MKRRQARCYALQLMFQYDFTHQDPSEIMSEFWKGKNVDPEIREFANAIFTGTVDSLARIDAIIKETAEHWVLERMATVDRNIIRLASYEILYRDDIPPLVSIDEAIEVAKKYSSSESSSFINGILDRIARKHQRIRN